MEDTISYHQLLAEQYEENARNLLVFQKEYEDDEDVEEHTTHKYENQEVDNPEEFKKFGGNRGHEDILIKPQDFTDHTKGSIRYDKDVNTHIIDIDSRFRAYSKPQSTATLNTNDLLFGSSTPAHLSKVYYPVSNPSDFIFQLPQVIKNVISVKITSISFPNIFYTFSKNRENITFRITEYPVGATATVTIKEGNYPDVSDLVTEIQTKLTAALTTASFTNAADYKITFDAIKNKITIKNINISPTYFSLDFTPATIKEPFNNGLGYNLGFEHLTYPYPASNSTVNQAPSTSYEGETFPDLYGDSYIYLAINDYNVIEHQNFNNTYFPVFAKLMLPEKSKNKLVTDIDLTNLVQREYNFLQPVNISRLRITLYDAYGNVIDLKGANFSFTLELKEVINMHLYEKMREI